MKKDVMVFEDVRIVVEEADNGEKTISVDGKNVNLNFNGVRLATVEEKVNLAKIYDFVNNHKYDGDEAKLDSDGKIRGLALCVKGVEFHGHWVEEGNKDTNTLSLNEFIPNYKAIIEGLSELDDKISSQFLSPKYYEDDFNDFEKALKDLDITMYDNSTDEYDILTTFCLPSSKLDDENFIKKFMELFISYKEKYDEELDVLY